MTRNLKALGLALVAMLAMSAIMVSSAQATETGTFEAAEYPAAFEATGSEREAFTIFDAEIMCAHAEFTSDPISGPSSELKVTPVYRNCIAPEIFPWMEFLRVTVTHNGCKYRFHHTTLETPSTHNWTLTVDVACPTGKQIEIHIYSDHMHGSSFCTLTVGSQTGLQALTADVLTARTPDDALLTGTVEGITVQSHGVACEGAETEVTKAAVYHIPTAGVTAQATNESEEFIDGWIG